jgi:Flp pilus assembly protein TadG
MSEDEANMETIIILDLTNSYTKKENMEADDDAGSTYQLNNTNQSVSMDQIQSIRGSILQPFKSNTPNE